MPAYISHAIMGNELYKTLINDGNILKTEINEAELRGYSLGPDLALLSKNMLSNPHNSNTQFFFLSMINYIKDNKLIENDHIMSLLYGHMAHYFLDINVHPLVYYIECGCIKVSMIPNHHLVEGYYSSYLTQKIMNCDIMQIKPSFFNQINLSDKNIKELLNTIYGRVYGDYNIVSEYNKFLTFFSLLEKIIKSNLISKDLLIKLSKFKEFIEVNNLTVGELTNDHNLIYTNPVTGERHNECLLSLFNRSIDMSLDAIKEVNECLYNNQALNNLEKVFSDLSYDTGVSCSLGKNLVYVRKSYK